VFIPASGLGYLEVFFHELGHCVAGWSFGIVTVPSFNFADGGGLASQITPRIMFLQVAVYLGVLWVGWMMWSDEQYDLLACLGAALVVHLFFAFSYERLQMFITYMGHGGSVLVGCFCLLRAALNKTVSDEAPELERYINMTFGFFVVMSNVVLPWKIITDPLSRASYEEGIGGHITNDLVVIADLANTTLKHVCVFSLCFVVVCLIVSAILYAILRERLEGDVPPGGINSRF
jgi:hypothetical protein